MTLKEMVLNHTWIDISPKFLKIYPESEQNMKGYEIIFERLKKTHPIETHHSIIITKENDYEEEYFEVSGLNKHPKSEEDKYPQGIEFTPWCEWVGMSIYKESLDNFSEQEIIVHCLYEMTFAGFSEEEIQKVINRTIKNKKNRELKSEEESDEITASVEEILKNWSEEN